MSTSHHSAHAATGSVAGTAGQAGDVVDEVVSKPSQPGDGSVPDEAPKPVNEAPLLLEAPGTSDRPTDEQIIAFQNQIKAEEAQKIEYVGKAESIEALKAEYATGNQVFVGKIDKLANAYHSFRRTRGDGNCFFRGFTFSLLEGMLVNRDMQECNRLLACVQEWKTKLTMFFQELVFEDAMELLVQQLRRIVDEAGNLEVLEADMRDDMVSNMIVMFIRMISSAEVQRREEFFFPFILGMYDEPPATIELFCQRHVECMGEESDHLHIVAITDALQVPVRIVYLDRSGMLDGGMGGASELEYNTHDFIPETCPPGTQPRVHLLYRPGHYDILYPK